MDSTAPSRRGLLRAAGVAGVGLVGVLAGCSGFGDDTTGGDQTPTDGDSSSTDLGPVPDGVRVLATGDPQQLLADAQFVRMVEWMARESPLVPIALQGEDLSSALSDGPISDRRRNVVQHHG